MSNCSCNAFRKPVRCDVMVASIYQLLRVGLVEAGVAPVRALFISTSPSENLIRLGEMPEAFGARAVNTKPPERGVFALDHDGECKPEMKMFLGCLKQNERDHYPCKTFSRAYLQCRMDKDLMSKEDLNTLGLEQGKSEYKRVDPLAPDYEQKK